MSALDRVRVGYAPLSDRIMVYRHGKDPRVALEKRDIEAQVMQALVDKCMQDSPAGSTLTFMLGDEEYQLRLRPVLARKRA